MTQLVLGLVKSQIQLQRRDFESAAMGRCRGATLEGVEAGSHASDYALLNLVTMYFQTARWEESRELVEQLQRSTSTGNSDKSRTEPFS